MSVNRRATETGVAPGESPRPRIFRRWERRARAVLFSLGALALGSRAVRAETVALWLFDEPLGASTGVTLRDSSPTHRFSLLVRAGEIVAGRFGRALRPMPRESTAPMDGSARRASAPNVTDSKLNLGAHDWTMECWLRLDAAARAEGVIWEMGTGPRGSNELVTRFSVLPAEKAFALAGLTAVPALGPPPLVRRVEYADPAGPPGGVALLGGATLATAEAFFPRETWCHVALVHRATGELRLYLAGKLSAVAALPLMALPHGDDAYVSIGCDARGIHSLAGAIDELRVSDHVVYTDHFSPPESFALRQTSTASLRPEAGYAVRRGDRQP